MNIVFFFFCFSYENHVFSYENQVFSHENLFFRFQKASLPMPNSALSFGKSLLEDPTPEAKPATGRLGELGIGRGGFSWRFSWGFLGLGRSVFFGF